MDLDALLRRIGQAAEQLTGAEASSILLLDEERKNLVFRVATGEKGQTVKKQLIPIGQGVAGWVAQHWKPVAVNDVGRDPRFTGQVDKASGFVTRKVLAVPMFLGGELLGVCEVLNRRTGDFGPEDESVLTSLAGFAAVSIANARFAQDQRNFFAHVLELLVVAIEDRDPKTRGHSVRTAELACAIGKKMGLDGQDYRDLYYGALLHDIGMIAMNDPQFTAQAGLGIAERTPQKLHPILGAELIKGINVLRGAAPLVRSHNEYFDGTGHPDRLAGEMIPLGARILCLVEHIEDVRLQGLSGELLKAKSDQMARSGSGTRFDPKVVEAYLSVSAELEALRV